MSKPVAWPWWQYLKIVVQTIVQDEGVCHLDAMRLHRMLIAVMVVANFWVVEVCYLSRNVKSASNTVGNIGGCCCCLEYEQSTAGTGSRNMQGATAHMADMQGRLIRGLPAPFEISP